jgi:predicted dithiol-disulfide oxidoreductase (DUF899 family)
MPNATASAQEVVSPKEWIAARTALLAREKEFIRLRDELAAERRQLPWVQVTKPYTFASTSGEVSLADLFDGRSQLILYHFMMAPGAVEVCRGCSLISDSFDSAKIHLTARDTTLVACSRAPLSEIEAFRKRMDWDFHWVSSFGTDFNYNFHVSFTPEEVEKNTALYNYTVGKFRGPEAPGLSVFTKDEDGNIFHTYSTYARGLDPLMTVYNLLDLTPKGRDEAAFKHPFEWLRLHDSYTESYFGSQPTQHQAAATASCCGSH